MSGPDKSPRRYRRATQQSPSAARPPLLNSRLEALEALWWEADRSKRGSSPFFVAVVVGPARYQDAVTVRECQIVLGCRRIVLAVESFEGRQAGLDHAGDELVALQ